MAGIEQVFLMALPTALFYLSIHNAVQQDP